MFSDILKDPKNLIPWLKEFEKSCELDKGEFKSKIVGTKEGIKWYRMRRLVSFIVWDIYTATAIAQYRRNNLPNRVPLLKEIGLVTGELPPALNKRLEDEYFKCRITQWVDQRPEGYSYFPYESSYFENYDRYTIHRIMTPELGQILTEALESMAKHIENVLGHYWVAGAVRVYAAMPKMDHGYHSDRWPLGIKKLMIYPSGAGAQMGSTQFILADGSKKIIDGGPGVWGIFENTLRMHQAYGGQTSIPRPSIEIPLIPSLKTNPVIQSHAIHVGFPFLPADFEELTGDDCPASFTAAEVMERTIARMHMLMSIMPDSISVPEHLIGLGIYD